MSGCYKLLQNGLAFVFVLFVNLSVPYHVNADNVGREFPFHRYFSHYLISLKTMGDIGYHREAFFAAAVLLPVSFVVDSRFQRHIQKYPIYPESISRIGDLYGNPYGYVMASCLIVFQGLVVEKDLNKTASKFAFLAESVLTTATITSFMKTVTHRRRPNDENFRSFPSGHTSGSFALASVIDRLYGRKAGIFAYGMATFVGTTRINDNKHYLSDVVGGAVLGAIVGRSFAKNFDEEIIKIVAVPGTRAVYLVYEF